MWFRNLQAFTFIEPFVMKPEVLETTLSAFRFMDIRPGESLTQGWVSPIEPGGVLVYAASGFLMCSLQTQEKILPASVIREALVERISAFEDREGRKISKKEKDRFKDEVTFELLNRAFTKTSRIEGCIDTKTGVLWVNAASSKKAEFFTTELRRALGSLRIELPKVVDVSAKLTTWAREKNLPASLQALPQFVLRDEETDALIRAQNQSVFSDEMASFLEGSRVITQLGIQYKDWISFTLKEDFSFKSLKFLEGVKAQSSDIFTETQGQQFDANFSLMTGVLRECWETVFAEFSAHAAQSST